MKKIFLAISIFCALSACKKISLNPSDVEIHGNSVSRIPKKVFVQSSATATHVDTVTYLYNTDKTVRQIAFNREAGWTFEYTNRNVSNRKSGWARFNSEEAFTYNQDQLSKWELGQPDLTSLDRQETYHYNNHHDIEYILLQDLITSCRDSLTMRYTFSAAGVLENCAIKSQMHCGSIDTIRYEFGKNSLNVLKDGVNTTYEFADKQIEFQAEVAERFLPVISKNNLEKILFRKYMNKYCTKITDDNGTLSTYKYTFDSWGRLVKIDRNSSYQGAATIYTYLLSY